MIFFQPTLCCASSFKYFCDHTLSHIHTLKLVCAAIYAGIVTPSYSLFARTYLRAYPFAKIAMHSCGAPKSLACICASVVYVYTLRRALARSPRTPPFIQAATWRVNCRQLCSKTRSAHTFLPHILQLFMLLSLRLLLLLCSPITFCFLTYSYNVAQLPRAAHSWNKVKNCYGCILKNGGKWRINIYNAARKKVCFNKLMHSAAYVCACIMKMLSCNNHSVWSPQSKCTLKIIRGRNKLD